MRNLPSLILFLTLVISVVDFASARPPALELGSRHGKDEQVVLQVVEKRGKIWPFIAETTETFTVPNGFVISYVRAVNSDDNNATVERVAGGVGRSNVALKFRSARGKRLNFIVEVYGHPGKASKFDDDDDDDECEGYFGFGILGCWWAVSKEQCEKLMCIEKCWLYIDLFVCDNFC